MKERIEVSKLIIQSHIVPPIRSFTERDHSLRHEKDGSYHIDQIFDGETVEEVLEYVQYNPKKLVRQLEIWVTKSVKQGKISLEEGKEFLSNYRSGLYPRNLIFHMQR